MNARYRVEWQSCYGVWIEQFGPGFRSRFWAHTRAWKIRKTGSPARVIDTRHKEPK